jgi:hypothetical protein
MADTVTMQLLTYTVMDEDYLNGKLMNVKGLENAVPANSPVAGSVGTVNNPIQSGIPIDPLKRDPVVFSFVYDNNGTTELRMLLATIVTPDLPPPAPSTDCFYSLLKMNTNGDWTALCTNVQLMSASPNSVKCANNPHGVAQIENMLYILDYDTQMIYFLDGDELNGESVSHELRAAFNIGSAASLLGDARAQALIALNNSLFALYIRCTDDGETHYPGILVRVAVSSTDNTSLTYATKTTVGNNPQMIIPINPTSGSPILLIPAIGGKQHNESVGNSGVSNITKVPAFGTWPSPAPAILVSNTPASVPIPPVGAPAPVSYTLDIQAIAASEEVGANGIVYILSGIYNGTGDNYEPKTFMLWKTTVGNLNTLGTNTSVWTAYSTGKLSWADDGVAPGYFWDIFYENKGTPGLVGRLWFLKGSPIIVSEAADYGAGNLVFNRGTLPGQIGGENVNSVDLTAETARQVQAGVSLKRGLRAHKPSIRAAKAAPTVTAAEEEEE